MKKICHLDVSSTIQKIWKHWTCLKKTVLISCGISTGPVFARIWESTHMCPIQAPAYYPKWTMLALRCSELALLILSISIMQGFWTFWLRTASVSQKLSHMFTTMPLKHEPAKSHADDKNPGNFSSSFDFLPFGKNYHVKCRKRTPAPIPTIRPHQIANEEL